MPSPLTTVSPPRSISVVSPVAASIRKSFPVTVCTTTSVFPSGVASIPFRLLAFGTCAKPPPAIGTTVATVPGVPSFASGRR